MAETADGGERGRCRGEEGRGSGGSVLRGVIHPFHPPKTNREEREIEREKEEKKKDGERREEDQRSAGDGWSDTDREREHQVRTGQE